jgi:hypothetical protein
VAKPGKALQIGIGGNGAAWVLGEEVVPGGQAIFRWEGDQWRKVDGGARKIAVDGNGNPWIIDSDNNILQWVNQAWTRRPGKAIDIAIGPQGGVFCIGQKGADGNGDIFEWKGNSNWANVGGRAVHIAVDHRSLPWVINVQNQVWRHDSRRFVQIPGSAIDIAIGGSGAVWVISTDPVGPDNRIVVWNGTGWTPVDGGAKVIAVGPNSLPWVAQAGGLIYQRV